MDGKKKNFVAIDFETATNTQFACQVGIAVAIDGVLVDSKSWLIQPPGNQYDENVLTHASHRITPEQTATADTFDAVWQELKPYLEGAHIVAHNKSTDTNVLHKNVEHYGLDASGIEDAELWDDTCTLFCGRGIDDICEAYGWDATLHHDAEWDATVCARLFGIYQDYIAPYLSLQNRPKEKENKPKSHRPARLSGDILQKDLEHADPNSPFYDKKVVITGFREEYRNELAVCLKALGADINTSISGSTQIVFAGPSAGSSKMKKVNEMIAEGKNVRILSKKDAAAVIAGELERF